MEKLWPVLGVSLAKSKMGEPFFVSSAWVGLGALPQWVPLAVGMVALLAVLVVWQRWHRQQRRQEQALQSLRAPASRPSAKPAAQLPWLKHESEATSESVLAAIEQLQKAGTTDWMAHAGHLLRHSDSRVRTRVLSVVGNLVERNVLHQLALHDPDPVLRAMASQWAARHPEFDDLLLHPDLAVRHGALRGRLEVAPTDAQAQASLATTAASEQPGARLVALSLIGFMTPAQQVALVSDSLRSTEPTLVRAAVAAVVSAPSRALVEQLIALLSIKALRKPAADGLALLGDAAVIPLAEALAQETDKAGLQHRARVCARLATPAARKLLVAVAQAASLPARAAALEALATLPTDAADAPLFHRLLEKELQFAQQLTLGLATAPAALRAALRYELCQGRHRLFGVLLQLYARPPVLAARHGVAHTTGERQALALEVLEEVVPRPIYRGLQALLNTGRLSEKVQLLDDLLGPTTNAEAVVDAIVHQGQAAFSAWTISVALRQWHPQPATVAWLYPHLHATNPLIQEGAWAVLRQLPLVRPAAYDRFVLLYPDTASTPITTMASPSSFSAHARVQLLQGTALFADISENILGTIVPIMKEVAYHPAQEIFAKGALGASLFIIGEGDVGIFSGAQHLATFHRGDFFGELALLDAEPRSATAVAQGPVVVFRLDQEDFYEVMEEHSEVLRNILRVLCQRLRRQNEQVLLTP